MHATLLCYIETVSWAQVMHKRPSVVISVAQLYATFSDVKGKNNYKFLAANQVSANRVFGEC